MNEEELVGLISTLEEGLDQVGLSSLVNQERIIAAEGKAEELTTGDVAQLHREWSGQRRGPASRAKAGDVRVRPLETAERLAQLLDLVEVAVGGTYAIEVDLRDDLKASLGGNDENTWDGQVIFVDPIDSALVATSPQDWILPDDVTLQQRAPSVREAILLINQLRGRAELPRSDRLRSTTGLDEDGNSLAIPGDWQ